MNLDLLDIKTSNVSHAESRRVSVHKKSQALNTMEFEFPDKFRV